MKRRDIAVLGRTGGRREDEPELPPPPSGPGVVHDDEDPWNCTGCGA